MSQPERLETLSLRAANRATLARQLLLGRAALDPVTALERIGGMQAQEPASPFIGLWSRLDGFSAADLRAAIDDRRAIKATLMRATLHLVSADDYRHLAPAVMPAIRARWASHERGRAVTRTMDEIAAVARAHAATPRSNIEMREHLAALGEPVDPQDLWARVRRYVPFIHVPADAPWAFGRRPAYVDADVWMSGTPWPTDEVAVDRLVRRYLGAFGPATLADCAAWSGVTITRLRGAAERIEGLRRWRDDRGRILLDLPDAPLPDADAPAPPRLLPMWDSLVLAHADRRRVLPDEYRRVVIAKNGDTLPTVLVDGLVAGLWWARRDGDRTRIEVEPFRPLPRRVRDALDEEAERLAAFVTPREPGVYGRFRATRARVAWEPAPDTGRPPGNTHEEIA